MAARLQSEWSQNPPLLKRRVVRVSDKGLWGLGFGGHGLGFPAD